jgi:hypothetical protein
MMSKELTVTYVGEESEITEGGITFKQGKAVKVPADHERAAKFAGNPTFEVKGEPETPDA